jgi:two-component system sensor histidine kinase RegB
MLDQARDNPVLKQDIELLRKQITVCRHGIATLLDRTGHARSEHARALDLVEFIREILGQWQTIRPEIELETVFEQPFDSPSIVAEQTIAQAITNLLNNAADASVENDSNFVRLRIASHNKHLSICIDDNGPGFSAHHSEQTASAVVSTKEDGFGIGLILSNATISRFGGEVHLHKRDQGGTRTEILLPLNRLVLS